MENRADHLKTLIASLPETPGVYQYLNKEGTIIYVGKAKNLKRRVSSYFNKNHDSAKVRVLVKQIYDLKYIVVKTEADALLLENNLIKKYQPRYNILLKDGKSYPWLCITKEDFPRIFKTRQVSRGARYFGPYISVWVLDNLLALLKELYPVRTCRLPLTEANIAQGKFEVCLQYHIHNCTGCCVGKQSKEDYGKMMDEITEILQGNSGELLEFLLKEIQQCASELRFEEAYALKKKYDALLQYQSKTVITTTHDDNLDVLGYEEDGNIAFVNILHINHGCVTQGLTLEYHRHLDEPKEELLSMALLDLRERIQSQAKTVLVPFLPDIRPEGMEFTIPQKGDKKKLVDLSLQNVRQYRIDRFKQSEKLNPEQRSTRLLTQLQHLLHLPKLPLRIECFDNSHISGNHAVAACVVYYKGRPARKEYRSFNIKTVSGPDDYASMREVVSRRYQRQSEEGNPLPDLIIADGGIGQMSSIREVVAEELHLLIPIAGLAKNEKHQTRELLFGFPPQVISLRPDEPLFRLLAEMQEEVHRVAISFHRNKRSKAQTHSALDEIAGIGEKTKTKLLSTFKSVARLKNAELSDLQKIVGTNRASIIYTYFHPELTAGESHI